MLTIGIKEYVNNVSETLRNILKIECIAYSNLATCCNTLRFLCYATLIQTCELCEHGRIESQ